MSILDELSREVEQFEAATENLAEMFVMMWKSLIGKGVPAEYAVRIIEKWIETTMKPPNNTG